MSNLMKQYRGAGGLALVLSTVSAMSVGACGDAFSSSCRETRTCAPSAHEGGAGGAPDDVGGEAAMGAQGGGDVSLGGSDAGQSQGGATVSGAAGEGGALPTCGDGIVQDSTEQCDDKNVISGDGCSSTCAVDAPPTGAYAWYKATKDDVTIKTATLLDGNDFGKAAWSKTNVRVQGMQAGADGELTASALYAFDAQSEPPFSIAHTVSDGSFATFTMRIRAKKGAARYISLSGSQPSTYATFDLQTGVVSNSANVQTAKMTPNGQLWFECEVTMFGPPAFGLVASGTSDPGSEALVWIEEAQVEQVYVTKWKDRIAGYDLADPNNTWRWIESSPDFHGASALESSSQSRLEAATDAENWSFLHDGSGGTIVMLEHHLAGEAFRGVVGTSRPTAPQSPRASVAIYQGAWSYEVTNDAKEHLFHIDAPQKVDGARWFAASFAMDWVPNAQFFENGTLLSSANATGAPSSSPSEGLGLGGGALVQKVSEVIVYKRTLSADEMAQLGQYFAPRLKQ